jgi:hypothetical protein
MRIALIIGVSDYQRADPLPSCKRDADAIETLLDSTHSFEHKLRLSGNLPSQDTKDQILAFLGRFRGQSISQALFYFSGHGTVQDGDLLYLLSDFDEERPRQTSIENKEVDSWLRDLAPEVTVKITDCCHSGMPYIKDPNSMESAIARSKGQFAACYFLSASHADQVTLAGDDFSEFTEHILRGLTQRPLGTIRYKDLIDSVLDSYTENSPHRPYIVQQGSMRDIFFEQTEVTLDFLNRLIEPPQEVPPSSFVHEEPTIRRSLLEAIQADAKGALTQKMAENHLNSLHRSIQSFQIDESLADIYDLSSQFSSAWDGIIENKEAVGKWLQQNGRGLFADAIEEDVKERVPRHLLDPFEGVVYPMGKIISKRGITGIRVTTDLEYDLIKTTLNPRYENLNKYEVAFLLLWSLRELVLFRYTTPLRAVNWKEHEVPEGIKWKISRFPASELGKSIDLVVRSLRELENLAKAALQTFQSPS